MRAEDVWQVVRGRTSAEGMGKLVLERATAESNKNKIFQNEDAAWCSLLQR
jgi:hypothetical protein